MQNSIAQNFRQESNDNYCRSYTMSCMHWTDLNKNIGINLKRRTAPVLLKEVQYLGSMLLPIQKIIVYNFSSSNILSHLQADSRHCACTTRWMTSGFHYRLRQNHYISLPLCFFVSTKYHHHRIVHNLIYMCYVVCGIYSILVDIKVSYEPCNYRSAMGMGTVFRTNIQEILLHGELENKSTDLVIYL